MALISFINKKTFEIKDEPDDYIYCDYDLRNVIAILNKKGYKTSFSCSGHNQVGLMWPLHKESIDDLEEYLEESKNDLALHFIKKDEKYFWHKDEIVSTYPYIFFQYEYEFTTLPNDFAYELTDGRSYLSKQIDFYKDEKHSIRKTDIEINRELDITYSDLEKWANELPYIEQV